MHAVAIFVNENFNIVRKKYKSGPIPEIFNTAHLT